MPLSSTQSELELQREKLLAKLNELVSPDLQARINEALMITAPRKQFEIKVSYSGTTDADPE